MIDQPDYYAILGVSRYASHDEIKAAHKRVAKQWMPLANQGDKVAEQKMKDANIAWSVLKDRESRTRYDDSLFRSSGNHVMVSKPPRDEDDTSAPRVSVGEFIRVRQVAALLAGVVIVLLLLQLVSTIQTLPAPPQVTLIAATSALPATPVAPIGPTTFSISCPDSMATYFSRVGQTGITNATTQNMFLSAPGRSRGNALSPNTRFEIAGASQCAHTDGNPGMPNRLYLNVRILAGPYAGQTGWIPESGDTTDDLPDRYYVRPE